MSGHKQKNMWIRYTSFYFTLRVIVLTEMAWLKQRSAIMLTAN